MKQGTAGGRPSSDVLQSLARFAGNRNFRSATTDELLIEDGYFRRPVRPEDLAFIDFSHPLERDSLLDLGGLIGHRLLLNAFECRLHQAPGSTAPQHLQAMHDFHDAGTVDLARRVQPLLEEFLFDAFGNPGATASAARTPAQQLHEFWESTLQRQQTLAALLQRSRSRAEDERFVLVQQAGLLPSREQALRHARGIGLTGLWPAALARSLCPQPLQSALQAAAAQRGLQLQAHRYWQFYLSTTLGCSNFLYSACWQPRRPMAALAAAAVCALHLRAFQQAFGDSLLALPPGTPADIDAFCSDIAQAVQQAALAYGAEAGSDFRHGFDAAAAQWALFDADLGQQLDWLGNMEQARETARRLMQRVEQQREAVRLDTFVETLDMCSTTHVHNEHRLVVVESGQMVFWANVDMRVHLPQGDMILVPRSRLHGSSITTDTCVYHQPVIPPDWLAQAAAGR